MIAAEEADAGVEPGDVDERARAEAHPHERLAIRADGDFVADAGGEKPAAAGVIARGRTARNRRDRRGRASRGPQARAPQRRQEGRAAPRVSSPSLHI